MDNAYFIELRNLRFETLPAPGVPDSLNDALDGWIPRGKGVYARLENRWAGGQVFDYVIITEDIVYYAKLTHELQPRLLGLKCFKACDMTAFAFILADEDGSEGGDVPQIRLMLSHGKRIKLILDRQAAGEAVPLMKQLSTRNFFIL